jgi:hypothetical protein
MAQLRLAEFLVGQRDYAAAEKPLLETHAKLEPHSGVVDEIRRRTATQLVVVYEQLGRPADAADWQQRLEEAATTVRASSTREDP